MGIRIKKWMWKLFDMGYTYLTETSKAHQSTKWLWASFILLQSIRWKVKAGDRPIQLAWRFFVEKFFVILNALRRERDYKVATMFQKVKVSPFNADSPESHYSKLKIMLHSLCISSCTWHMRFLASQQMVKSTLSKQICKGMDEALICEIYILR